MLQHLTTVVKTAEANHIPLRPAKAKTPWIQASTLAPIDQKAVLVQNNQHLEAMQVQAQIKYAARKDKKQFLRERARNGDWS